MTAVEPNQRRTFRLPSLAVAAAEFRAQQSRAMRGPIGCLFLLAASASIIAFLLFFELGGRLLAGALGLLMLGFVLLRLGAGILAALVGAIGAGAAVAGVMAVSGVEAAWAYWTAASLVGLVGCALAASVAKIWPGFIRARFLARAGCRIGFFRPFRGDYSAQAKNLLLPLLQGYGTVFFVTDESMDESKFDGLWSKDYQALPGLVSGHRYTNDEWQKAVRAAVDTIDVAVIDISVPSANVVWEIKQCYDRLPSHRIILVASAAVLPMSLPASLEDPALQTALWAHVEPILRGLQALQANRTTQPLFLIYAPGVEGQVWLGHALFGAMANIVATESGAAEAGERA